MFTQVEACEHEVGGHVVTEGVVITPQVEARVPVVEYVADRRVADDRVPAAAFDSQRESVYERVVLQGAVPQHSGGGLGGSLSGGNDNASHVDDTVADDDAHRAGSHGDCVPANRVACDGVTVTIEGDRGGAVHTGRRSLGRQRPRGGTGARLPEVDLHPG